MKIVLVHNKQIKLFPKTVNFDQVLTFAASEFKLAAKTIQLTYKDEEGDCITILSQDDIEAMQAISQGSQYLKVTVEGSAPTAQQEQKEIRKTQISETVEAPQEEKREEDPKTEAVYKVFENWPRHRRGQGHKRHSHSKEGSPRHGGHRRHGSGHKKEKFMKMKGFFNELVTKLVDQRVNNLLPCLKERILNGEPVAEIVSDLVHKGISCKGCNTSPISGIRYQCPTCIDFNFCQNCEATIPHDHPLLKIKKIIDQNKEEEDFLDIKKLFKKFMRPHHGRGSSSSGSKDKCHKKWKGHHYYKKTWGLSAIFGGEPEQYAEFANKHEDLRPKETFKKWAEENGIPEEEFNTKFVSFRCQKLSGFFGKAPEEYKKFVGENIDLNQREMMDKLYELGIEKRENKRQGCWGGRRFNFNQTAKAQEGSPKEESARKEKSFRKKEKSFSKEKPKHRKSKSPKAQEEPKVRQAKGAILIKMLDIFGNERQKEYIGFVDKYFSLGEERIIDLWMQQ